MSVCVVIPSIRKIDYDFLSPLGDTPVCVVDDSDGAIRPADQPKHVTVIDYAFRRRLLGGADELVPKKSPSCKGAGLLWAWKEGFETVVLLDDDCDVRATPDYLARTPVGREVQAETYDGPWVNPTGLLTDCPFWSRGLPYEYRVPNPPPGPTATVKPLFNMGLWSGVPDINGADKLAEDVRGTRRPVTADDRRCDRTLWARRGQKLPLSIMNVQLHRSLIPAFYQPPDYRVGEWWIRRHDDVWSCLVLKTLMDRAGDAMTCGQPIINHVKAGDMLREVVAEHVTCQIQHHLETVIDAAVRDVVGAGYVETAEALGERMAALSWLAPGLYAGVVADYGRRIAEWARLFA